MATEKKSNTLAQIGPVAAPLAGVVLAIIFIAVALLTSSVSDSSDELTKAVGATRKKLDDPTVTPSTGPEIPLADNVVHSFARKGSNNWSVNEGNKGLLGLPIKWEVVMDAPVGDPFQVADENGDGYIDLTEWGRSDFPTRPGSEGKFVEWDRNPKDDQISREEFKNPPQNELEAFEKLDKSDDGKLTAKDGEITTAEESAWDSYPFEGEISFEEYEARFKPKQERGLGPVSNVQAKVDAATMEIVVTWKDPEIADKPEDISFMILRRAPENKAKREKEYSKKVIKFNEEQRAWDGAFSAWWNDPATDADGKTNKQKWPKKTDAEKEFAKTNPRPIPPEKVSDWETVTVTGPITGNEYRDKNFDTDVTYTYAVFMGTQKKPKREQNVRKGELASNYQTGSSTPRTRSPPATRYWCATTFPWAGKAPPATLPASR